MPTDEDLLAAARAALLTALQTGQSVTFGGRSYTSHDLGALREIIAQLSHSATPRVRLAAVDKGV